MEERMNNIPFKNKDIEFLGKKKRIREMRGEEYVNMPNGEVSSHLMSSRGKEAFPTVFPNKPGSHEYKDWTDMPNTSEAYNEAKKRGEVVKFATAKRAEKMAFGAWKKGDARKEAMQNYANYKKSQRSR
jgi:hypothetical protein